MVAWKIPRLLYKRGSWTIALGVIHILISSVRGAKFSILGATTVAFAVLFIVATDIGAVLVLSAVALLIIWGILLYKAFRYALTPARFVQAQRRLLERTLAGDLFWNQVNVEDQYKSGEIERIDRGQAATVVQRVGIGLIAYRGSQVWAHKLDLYRQSGASIVFSAVSIIALLAQGILTFTMVNQAIYKIDPDQFAFEDAPGLVTFAYYSFSSLFVSEISQIRPDDAWSSSVSILAGFSTAVVVFILIATVFFGYRESRTSEAATREIDALRVNADLFATRLGQEYDMSVEQIFKKLEDLGWDLLGLLAYLARNAPPPSNPPPAVPDDGVATAHGGDS